MPKHCPICGEPLEDGLCLCCGYDLFLDSFGGSPDPVAEPEPDSLLLGDLDPLEVETLLLLDEDI